MIKTAHDPSTMLLAIGTRPEIIKMAPIYLELKQRGIKPLVLHTGQHNDMAKPLYDLFGMEPDYSIELDRKPSVEGMRGSAVCDLSQLGSLLLDKISGVMLEADPSVVLVHGDTSSALMTALAAFYQKRRIAHVEAGLRSHKEYHPFPEEKNRALISQLSHFHFAPTERARRNLLTEGVSDHAIHVVGNTIVQATQLGADRLNDFRKASQLPEPDLIGKLELRMVKKQLVLVTVHRRENHEHGIKDIARAVHELIRQNEDLIFVWPVHPNPKVMDIVHGEMSDLSEELADRLYLTKPLSYPVLLWILKNSWSVLTDSGGIQEEAVALNTPVMVLRETTERPEVIEVGAGMLVGTQTQTIINKFTELFKNRHQYEMMRRAKNPFGDGMVASNICNILLSSERVGQTGERA
jgi:UDP-N-acetylglucosamine 2-epimerase